MPEVTVGTWLPPSQTRQNNLATRHRDSIGAPSKYSSNHYMADNKKQEKDYTKEVDALVPEAEAVVKVRSIEISSPLSTILIQFTSVWQPPGRSG